MASTKTYTTLLASTSITTSGGTIAGTAANTSTAYGGAITIKLTNGSSAPTVAPEADVLVSGDGTNYKIIASFYGDTTNSSVNQFAIDINPGYKYVNVQFSQATTNAYTAEAFWHELTTV
ncbi:MAG: hypothetical protein KGL39_34705 [Patescibacteria group bacterium]|nr:hypothetical protein [Patescibacteria group bacterium]